MNTPFGVLADSLVSESTTNRIASVASAVAAKRVIASMLRYIPPAIRGSFIRRAALAPPFLKTRNFQRLCARMCDNGRDEEQLIETNLGIASHIRCRVPL